MSRLLSLKKLKSALSENLPMKEFFMSATFKYHIDGIIKMVSEKYNNAAIYFSPVWGGKYIAYTDNHKVCINLNNDLISNMTDLEKRYLANLGLLGHELGHVLYTDFNQDSNWLESLSQGQFYGKYDNKYQTAVNEILGYKDDEVVKDFLAQVYHSCSNTLEDAYVNYRISHTYTGTFNNALKLLHSIQFEEELKESGETLSDLMNILLSIVVGHKVPKIAQKYSTQVDEMKNIVRGVETQTDVLKRVQIVNNLFLYLWSEIKLIVKNIKDMEQAMQNMQQSSNGGSSEKGDEQSGNQSGSQSGNQSDIQKGQDAANKVLQQIKRVSEDGKGTGIENEQKKNAQEAGRNQKGSFSMDKSDDKTSNGTNKSSSVEEKKKAEKAASSKNGKDSGDGEKAENEEGEDGESGMKSGDSSATDSSLNTEGDSLDSGSKSDSRNSDFSEVPSDVQFHGDTGVADSTQNALDALLSDFAREMIKKHPDISKKLIADESAKEIVGDSASCHYGYPCTVNRISAKNRKLDYDYAAKTLLPISKRLQKSVGALLEDKLDGGCMKNLLRGNKVNPAASASNDGRIFKRNCLPEEQDLAVSLLIDESGSMCGYRIEKALETAIIIEDFCAGLGVPIAITGHRDSGGCKIDEFIRFDDNRKERKYNLANLSAGGCNRDGLALRYCIKNLLERDEENKLMIIISDGRPNSNGYYGNEAARDLYSAKREFEKKGGKLIAAAIGDDKDTIQKIYKDSFLDITDLNTLPMKMVKLISRYLKD